MQIAQSEADETVGDHPRCRQAGCRVNRNRLQRSEQQLFHPSRALQRPDEGHTGVNYPPGELGARAKNRADQNSRNGHPEYCRHSKRWRALFHCEGTPKVTPWVAPGSTLDNVPRAPQPGRGGTRSGALPRGYSPISPSGAVEIPPGRCLWQGNAGASSMRGANF
jgi:hypothetical protein